MLTKLTFMSSRDAPVFTQLTGGKSIYQGVYESHVRNRADGRGWPTF